METAKVKRKRRGQEDKPEDWTVIWTETADEVEECISDPTLIWPIIRRTIVRLLDEGRSSLPALEIRCAEMVGSVWVTVRSEDVITTLKKELDYRLQREEYEECATIRDLIDRAQKGPGSVKKSADTDLT
jgi:hypothetical protein